MNYAVTGANGLLGLAVCNFLIANNENVFRLCRKVEKNSNDRYFVMGEIYSEKLLENIDVLIHCAYDQTIPDWAEIERVNINGSISLFKLALEKKIKKIIFISTISAFNGCVSKYGKSKIIIEDFCLNNDIQIIRPGLIFSDKNGGMMRSLNMLVGKLPLLPNLGNDLSLYMEHIDDLVRVIYKLSLAQEIDDKIVTVANENLYAFNTILKIIAKKMGKRIIFIPFNWRIILLVLKIVEFFKIKISFRSDNLLGLVHINPLVDFKPVKKLEINLRKFE